MSTCISRHGEFSEHTLDNSHTCTLCHVLDEEALRAALAAVEQDRDRLSAELEQTRGERDQAIAHDRQPYPTADAYAKACQALDAAEDNNASPERAREHISAASTWLRMAEILNYATGPKTNVE